MIVLVHLAPVDPVRRLIILRRLRREAERIGCSGALRDTFDECERAILRQDAARRRS